VTFEQHFYATDEFPEIDRGVLSDYRTVAASSGVLPALFDRFQPAVALGTAGTELASVLDADAVPRITAVGCWPLENWVVVSRALAFAHEPNARPWTYFVHSVLMDAEVFATVFGANPFRVLRQPGLFDDRPPKVPAGGPLLLQCKTVDVDAGSAIDADEAGRIAQFARLFSPHAADLLRTAAGGPPLLLRANLEPGRPEPLEGLFLALPLGLRRELYFWSYRLAVKSFGPFRLIVVPPLATVSGIAAETILSSRPLSAAGPVDPSAADATEVPTGSFVDFAAECIRRERYELISQARRFIEAEVDLGGTPEGIEAGLRAFRLRQRLEQAPTLEGYLDLARGLMTSPRAPAVKAGFDELCFALQYRLDAPADREALQQFAPQLPGLLAGGSKVLGAYGASSEAATFVGTACDAVMRMKPPGPWQARFLQAMVADGALQPADAAAHSARWLHSLPGDFGNGTWRAVDWLVPLAEVMCGNAVVPADAAWMLLDAAAAHKAADTSIGQLLQDLWERFPQSREAEGFVTAAVKLGNSQVLYAALKQVFRARAVDPSSGRGTALAAALKEQRAIDPDVGQRLAECLAGVLAELKQASKADVQRVIELLGWLELVRAHLSNGFVVELVTQLERLIRRGTTLSLGKQFYVMAYRVLLSANEPVAALNLCALAVKGGIDARQHLWELEVLWGKFAGRPQLTGSYAMVFLDLAASLGQHDLFCKVLASLLPWPELPVELENAVVQFAGKKPDQCTSNVFRALAQVSGRGELRGTARSNAMRLLEWIGFAHPPQAQPNLPSAEPAGVALSSFAEASAGASPMTSSPFPSPVPTGAPVAVPPADGEARQASEVPPEPTAESLLGKSAAKPPASPGGAPSGRGQWSPVWSRLLLGGSAGVLVLCVAVCGWVAWPWPWFKADVAPAAKVPATAPAEASRATPTTHLRAGSASRPAATSPAVSNPAATKPAATSPVAAGSATTKPATSTPHASTIRPTTTGVSP
jgi:hypothetical protein